MDLYFGATLSEILKQFGVIYAYNVHVCIMSNVHMFYIIVTL